MPRKRFSTEQIVTKLRQAEVELGRGLHVPLTCPQWLYQLLRESEVHG